MLVSSVPLAVCTIFHLESWMKYWQQLLWLLLMQHAFLSWHSCGEKYLLLVWSVNNWINKLVTVLRTHILPTYYLYQLVNNCHFIIQFLVQHQGTLIFQGCLLVKRTRRIQQVQKVSLILAKPYDRQPSLNNQVQNPHPHLICALLISAIISCLLSSDSPTSMGLSAMM